MEVNKIQEELARLIELVDGWAGSHDVPGIERDLVLDKLKKLYAFLLPQTENSG